MGTDVGVFSDLVAIPCAQPQLHSYQPLLAWVVLPLCFAVEERVLYLAFAGHTHDIPLTQGPPYGRASAWERHAQCADTTLCPTTAGLPVFYCQLVPS